MGLLSKITRSVIMMFIMLFQTASANNPTAPSFPEFPPSYEVLHTAKLLAAAKVSFPSYHVDNTNGYQVTAPNGTEFIVDNITKPKCIFYGTYVSTNDDGFLGVSSNLQVRSNVYIGEVNFDNCQ